MKPITNTPNSFRTGNPLSIALALVATGVTSASAPAGDGAASTSRPIIVTIEPGIETWGAGQGTALGQHTPSTGIFGTPVRQDGPVLTTGGASPGLTPRGGCAACPSGATNEGEANCGLPTDTFNGGCNSSPPVFSPITLGQTVCGTAQYNGSIRDTDWYQITLASRTQVTWAVTAEFPVAIGILASPCPQTNFIPGSFANSSSCVPAISVVCLDAGTYSMFVAPQFTGTVACGGRYVARLTGASSGDWTQRAVSGPTPRETHAMAYDSARGVTVLFGGWDGVTFNNDTWEWNGNAWSQRSASGPSARYYHAMAYDSARGVTVLFGGAFFDGSYHYNSETWEWNGSVWTMRTANGPSPRAAYGMAYDSGRGVTILFGGTNAATGITSGDTWEWDGAVWTQRSTTGPSPRYSHTMSYDAARGVTVLFGGSNGTANAETWEWNGTGAGTWTQRVVAGPTPRQRAAMVYDSARAVTMLFGGSADNGSRNSETWDWNGTGGGAWTQRATCSGPSQRDQHAMAYDSARAVTVLFGGNTTAGVNGETWELGVPLPCVPPSITTQPIPQTACITGSVSFTAAATGSVPLSYQWRLNSIPVIAAAGHITGVVTPTLTITNPVGADSGSYDCVVTNACGSATSNGAALTLNSGPSITQQPGSATTCTSFPATFTVTATGTAPLGYQWQVAGPSAPGVWVNIVNGTHSVAGLPPLDASGALTATMTLTEPNGGGDSTSDIRCVVTNVCGTATSNPASLVVTSPTTGACCHGTTCSMTLPGGCSGTFVGVGAVCIPQVRGGFMNACCPADINNSGAPNVQDIFDFLAAWFAGC